MRTEQVKIHRKYLEEIDSLKEVVVIADVSMRIQGAKLGQGERNYSL